MNKTQAILTNIENFKDNQIQPSSIDLSLSEECYEIDTSFLSPTKTVRDNLNNISKERIENGGFIGYEHIKKDLKNGVERKLVGIKPLGKLPAREGTQIFDKNEKTIGEITSGGYSPSLQAPIAMGYINSDILKNDCEVLLNVRGNLIPAEITSLPFVEHKYFRGNK